MLKKILARFKKVFTVQEWKDEARDAMRRKEFVVEALSELHRVEKAEAAAEQDRVISRNQQGHGMVSNTTVTRASSPTARVSNGVEYGRYNEKKRSDLTLADLMNSIKLQQAQ